jgi:hypothetical protein
MRQGSMRNRTHAVDVDPRSSGNDSQRAGNLRNDRFVEETAGGQRRGWRPPFTEAAQDASAGLPNGWPRHTSGHRPP